MQLICCADYFALTGSPNSAAVSSLPTSSTKEAAWTRRTEGGAFGSVLYPADPIRTTESGEVRRSS
jgi:hypothetical protein